MKIKVELLVEVDPQEWANTYGGSSKAADVREDVQDYVLNSVQGLAGIDESEAEVTLK